MKFEITKKSDNTPSPTRAAANDIMHGVKLVDILEYLVEKYGWEEMGREININCFTSRPTIKSSLKFLRRTPWARDKVEAWYLESVTNESKD